MAAATAAAAAGAASAAAAQAADKKQKTEWTALRDRTGPYAASQLDAKKFDAVHCFVDRMSWSSISNDEDPFRGGQMNTEVIMHIMQELVLKRLIPMLETFETGAEMQTRPWLLALIASWYPLATQCLDTGDGTVYLKAELSEGMLKDIRDFLGASMASDDATMGQFLKHEDSTLWKGQHKADVTAYAFRKEALLRGEFQEELAARLVTLVTEAKDSLGKDKVMDWLTRGRYQNADYSIQGAQRNAENTGEANSVVGMGTDVERWSPSVFVLERLIKIVANSVVAVPGNPLYVNPQAADVGVLLANARVRINQATGKKTLPDGVYAVGKVYMTSKVAWFLHLPLSKTDPTIVQREALAFIQGLSIVLCGKRAKTWTLEHVKNCIIAFEAYLKKEIERIEVHGDAKETFDASFSAF